MIKGLCYLTAGLWTFNTVLLFASGRYDTGIQVGIATIIFWLWAYILESDSSHKENKNAE